ncbi:MAG: hypothetical protein RI601_00945 [Desulfurivibrionaceae bacterium]|nr:hypothetical protein [Desulfurivibrionaceae bacterium]
MSTKEQQEIPAPTSPSDQELQDARRVINIFIQSWRNYGLYPEDHVSTIKSFENLVAPFGNFFRTHGDLRVQVEKDRLLYKSESIYEVSQQAPSEDIITLLYRDGIKWIEFQEGLPLEEIASFFRIAHKYRLFAEEIEGDIVTALTDEELEYIDFKAVDIFWQEMLLIDFSQLPPPAPQPEDGADQNGKDHSPQPAGPERKGMQARSIADPSIGHGQLKLSTGDYEILQHMVQKEESWNFTEDLIELLLIILKSQSEQEKFADVLKSISELTVATIQHDKFDLAVKLFQSLRTLLSPETSPNQNWQSPLIKRFFQDLSKPEILQLISEKLLQVHTSELEKLRALGQILHYCSQEVIPFLVPVIMQRSSPEIQQMVSEVIVQHSQRDIGPLEKIIEQHGTEMGDKLLVILNSLQGDRVNKMLFKMCDHPSDKVRRKAIKELINRDPQYVQRLFSFIDDPDKIIRSSILAAFAKDKSSTKAKMLLKYLQENAAQKEPDHIFACYEALGRCGSDMAVPYLRRILLSRGWNSFMGSGKLIFREGAAVALALIDTPQAKDALQKASQSRFSVIRQAFDRTSTIPVTGENTND